MRRTDHISHKDRFIKTDIERLDGAGCRTTMKSKMSDNGVQFKAENQLGLPIVKALDILEGVGLNNIPIIGLTTVESTWQIMVGYICVPPERRKKVLESEPNI